MMDIHINDDEVEFEKAEFEYNEELTHDTPYKLRIAGLVPSTYPRNIRRVDTATVEGNEVVAEELDLTLRFVDDVDLPDGTEVKLQAGRNVFCKTTHQVRREEEQKENQRRFKEAREELRKEKRKEKAREFWSEYNIPVEYELAYNESLGQLTRGSSGTGMRRDTVYHLRVLDDITDGRLERSEGELLCKARGDWKVVSVDGTENYGSDITSKEDSSDVKYCVSCKTCRKRMKRWERQHTTLDSF